MKRTIEEEKEIMLGMMRKLSPDSIKEELANDVVPEVPSEIKEGNAFSGAAAKAKEEGKDTFEFEGKTYNVK